MNIGAKVLLFLATVTLAVTTTCGSASAGKPVVRCSIDSPSNASTAIVGSTLLLSGSVNDADRINFTLSYNFNNGPNTSLPLINFKFQQNLSPVIEGENKIVVGGEVANDDGTLRGVFTCSVQVIGVLETTTTTTSVPPTIPDNTLPNSTGASTQGAGSTRSSPAATPEAELALTGKSSLPLGFMGLALALLGTGVLGIARKQAANQQAR